MSKLKVFSTCDRRYNTFDMKKEKLNGILKIGFFKTTKTKKNLKKIKKGSQKEAKLWGEKTTFFLLKYEKPFTFFF